MSCRQIDQGRQGQYFSNLCFGVNSDCIVDMHSKGLRLESDINFLISFFYVLYTFRLKAPGLNPLNNSKRVGLSQYDSLPSFLYI